MTQGHQMRRADDLVAVLRAVPLCWRLLACVRDLELPDCWIGAGFVRNTVWDWAHGRRPSPSDGDVDVVWFDASRQDRELDQAYESQLRAMAPGIGWSVKNQARMHLRNGDQPYASTMDAMRHWPETATAVAVRRTGRDGCEIAAPFGLDDLMDGVLRPTPHFASGKRDIYRERLRLGQWRARWPRLRED